MAVRVVHIDRYILYAKWGNTALIEGSVRENRAIHRPRPEASTIRTCISMFLFLREAKRACKAA